MEIDMTREEAIKELRGFIGQLTEGCQEVIKVLVPELRESEDERIRKEIIECIETLIKAPGANPRLCDWIAYLEKQKESLHIQETCKENADSFTDACKDVIVAIEKYLDWLTGYPDYAPKGKYSIRDMLHCLSLLEKQKPENVSATTMIPSCWTEQQKEQKPAEYIKRNSKEWYALLSEQYDKGFWKGKAEQKPAEWVLPEDFEEAVYKVANFISPFDNQEELRKTSHRFAEQLFSLAKKELDRAAEWSEEDEKKRNGLIKGLQNRMGFGWASDPFSREDYIVWLKSLRPNPHWKPSEEQMRVLQVVVDEHWDVDGDALYSLYTDLKELM